MGFSTKQNIQVIKGARKGFDGTVLENLGDNYIYVSVQTGFGNRVKTVFKSDELKLKTN